MTPGSWGHLRGAVAARGAALDQRSGCWQRGREEGKAGAPQNHELLCVREEKSALGRCLAVCVAASPTEKTPRPLKMHRQPNRVAAPSLQPTWLPAVVLSDSILGLFLVFTLKNKNKTNKKKNDCTTHRNPRSGPSSPISLPPCRGLFGAAGGSLCPGCSPPGTRYG